MVCYIRRMEHTFPRPGEPAATPKPAESSHPTGGGSAPGPGQNRAQTDLPPGVLAIRLANTRRALARERGMIAYFAAHPVRYPWGGTLPNSRARLQALGAAVRDLARALAAVRPWSPALHPGELPPRRDWPRCGARTRSGRPCVAPLAIVGGRPRSRCRLHGGLSTGPRGRA